MIKLSRDTKSMLKQILNKFIEQQHKKALIKACIFDTYKIGSMKDNIRQTELYHHVTETLRHPLSNEFARMIKDCLKESRVHHHKVMGYFSFAGLKRK